MSSVLNNRPRLFDIMGTLKYQCLRYQELAIFPHNNEGHYRLCVSGHYYQNYMILTDNLGTLVAQ